MLTFAALVPQVEQLSAEIHLAFTSPNDLRQQIETLNANQTALAELQVSIQPYHDCLQATVNRLNTIEIARGALVVGRLLLGADGDDNSGEWLENLLDLGEEGLELWEFFEEENVKNANLIRLLYQQIHSQYQQIVARKNQVTQLTKLAESCLDNQEIWQALPDSNCDQNFLAQPSSNNLDNRWHKLLTAAKWILPFSQRNLSAAEQLKDFESRLLELQKFQDSLEHLGSTLDSDQLSAQAISKIISFYRPRAICCAYDLQDRPVITIDNQQYEYANLKESVHQITATLAFVKPKLIGLQQLAQIFTTHQTCQQLWKQDLSQRDFATFVRSIERANTAAFQPLLFEEGCDLKAQLTQLQTSHAKLKQIQQHLQNILVLPASEGQMPINPRALNVLLRLCGCSLTAIGFDREGQLIFEQGSQDDLLVWDTVRQECDRLNNYTKTMIAQLVTLGRIAVQCTKSDRLATQLAQNPQVVRFLDLERELKALGRQGKTSINFLTTRRQIRLQAENIQEAVDALQSIDSNLAKLINHGIDDSVDNTANPVTLSAFIALFGGFQAIRFNADGQLETRQANEWQLWRLYLQQCDRIKRAVEQDIMQAKQSVKLAMNALKDITLYRQLTGQQKRSRLLRRGAIAAGAVIAISIPLWATTTIAQGHLSLSRAQTLIQQASSLQNSNDLKALETAYINLKNANNLLKTVSQLPGSPYQRSQIELANCQSQMSLISERYYQIKEAAGGLSQAQQLAREATELTNNPPYPLSIWQEADAKYQEAIDILRNQKIGVETLPELELTLADYQGRHKLVREIINLEQQATSYEYQAERLMEDVQSLMMNGGSVNQATALKKCQSALQLLAGITAQVSSYQLIQTKLSTYTQQCQKIATVAADN